MVITLHENQKQISRSLKLHKISGNSLKYQYFSYLNLIGTEWSKTKYIIEGGVGK